MRMLKMFDDLSISSFLPSFSLFRSSTTDVPPPATPPTDKQVSSQANASSAAPSTPTPSTKQAIVNTPANASSRTQELLNEARSFTGDEITEKRVSKSPARFGKQ